MAVATARVASLSTTLSTRATVTRVTKASVGVSAVGIRAVAGNVTDLATLNSQQVNHVIEQNVSIVLTYLVAFLGATTLAAERTTALGTVAANVTGLTTSIAGFGILRTIRAFAT